MLGDRAVFIVLEGIDGSGKTTIALELANRFKRSGYRVLLTREPTDGPIGKLIRSIIESGSFRNPLIEVLLFASDRIWHNEYIIKPNLSKVDYIISDRYLYSSLAYQTVDSPIDEDFIMLINKGIIRPDFSFFIDVDPETAIKRISHRKNIFENLFFLKKVYNNYLNLVNKGLLIKIHGKRPIHEIVDEIVSIIKHNHLSL